MPHRILFFAALFFVATQSQADSIRLGWQLPWATQGQLVMALKHSNIPELAGIEIDYTDFAYGGPLNQAALAGDVDILLTADQPAAVLIARGSRHKIVSRMMYNRTCIYVPTNSNVEKLADLADASIGGPVGAAAERIAMADLRASGVDIDRLSHSKLDMSQQAVIVRRDPAAETWATIDALYGFDPLPAAFEENGLVKMISCGKVLSLVLASDDMIENRQDELVEFLRAFHAAWAVFASEPEVLNKRYLADSGLELSEAALEIAAAVEPNRFAAGLEDIRLTFTDDDAAIFETAVDFLMERDIIDKKLDLTGADVTALGPLDAALSDPGRIAAIVEAVEISP
ncbi:MAG: ABC transporter substrate-binding protein [Rhodobacter sp.]|nr:ABC transporter substrate-binding protein [Rhodobacter sp.]